MIWKRKPKPRSPHVAPGTRIYAVGDIHGRRDLLDRLLGRIEADMAQHPHQASTLVFVGDYVDRGPHAAQVISRLIEVQRRHRVVCLKGNHEAFLLQFLENPATLPNWAEAGGLSTLMSYGLAPPLQPTADQSAVLAPQLREAMPASHQAFLSGLVLTVTLGDFFFVHAGVRPYIKLADQKEEDLLWIRDEFLFHKGRYEKCIVHGHTPVSHPEVKPNRINIDTGAFATGKLTCLVLEGDTKRFL